MKRGGAMEIPQANLCSSLAILCISCINLFKLLNFTEPLYQMLIRFDSLQNKHYFPYFVHEVTDL